MDLYGLVRELLQQEPILGKHQLQMLHPTWEEAEQLMD
jgi:hypothetical protein